MQLYLKPLTKSARINRHFKAQNISEVMDLNILPNYRKMHIFFLLLERATKKVATRSDNIGIRVSLYTGADGGYGGAQRLYAKHSYVSYG